MNADDAVVIGGVALSTDAVKIIGEAQKGHEPKPTDEGWVDCSCGWESNHVRGLSDEEAEQMRACAEFDAETQRLPPEPYKPELHPFLTPTEQETADLHAWNDWQRAYRGRVRPVEPSDWTGEPERTNDSEWLTHFVAVGRDAAIAEHLSQGGSAMNVPEALAMLGVEKIAADLEGQA